MDAMNPRLLEVFCNVQRGLPRQGPGNNASTLKALELCSELPDNPTVLDIGCGPGMQTIALAEASSGQIIAVDTCDEYLDELRQRVRQASLTNCVEVKHADMMELDLPEVSIALIWCEAAAYIMGISEALLAWRKFLRDKGYLAFSRHGQKTRAKKTRAKTQTSMWQPRWFRMWKLAGSGFAAHVSG